MANVYKQLLSAQRHEPTGKVIKGCTMQKSKIELQIKHNINIKGRTDPVQNKDERDKWNLEQYNTGICILAYHVCTNHDANLN